MTANRRLKNGWDSVRIDSVGQIQGGRQRSEKIVIGTMQKYLRVANVFDGYIDYSDVLEMPFTESERTIYFLEPGDILLNEGQSLELVGRSAIYDEKPHAFCFQNTLIRFRPSTEITSEFAIQVFRHYLHTGKFAAVAARTTSIAHLGVERFASLHIPLPPIPEQKAIAGVLSAWDRAIEQTTALVAAKQRLKQGLMQQLLTGKRRFKGFKDEWRECQLGDLFDDRREPGTDDLPLLAVTLDAGVIRRDSRDAPVRTNLEHEEHLLVRKDDIAYNMMRMWQGGSGRATEDGVVSPAYVVCKPKSQIESRFADHLFHIPRMIYLFWAYSYGLTDDRRRLYFDGFSRIPTRIPSLEEQRRIADAVDCLGREVNQLDSRLISLRKQKRGLMQKLLTGEVRVSDKRLKQGAKS